MTTASFSSILPWILVNGYLMIFVAIIIGGPIFISAAAFAAALGYLNVYFIFSLAFFGEMAIDIIFYFVGYIGRAKVVEKFGHFLGLTQPRIKKLEELLSKHTWKTIFIIKYSPIIPVPGFVMVGASKLNFKRFLFILFTLSLPKAVFFTLIGYFFGRAYGTLSKYFYYGQYLIIGVIVIFIIIDYIFVKISKKISREEIDLKS
jgi:membrane protein DedA with SNARE-associated domain